MLYQCIRQAGQWTLRVMQTPLVRRREFAKSRLLLIIRIPPCSTPRQCGDRTKLGRLCLHNHNVISLRMLLCFRVWGKFKKEAAMLFAPRGWAKMSAVVISLAAAPAFAESPAPQASADAATATITSIRLKSSRKNSTPRACKFSQASAPAPIRSAQKRWMVCPYRVIRTGC